MSRSHCVTRIGDMDPHTALGVLVQPCGDMVVFITNNTRDCTSAFMPDSGHLSQVEFTLSGGRSHRTREALRALVLAIEADNRTRPISTE